MILQNLPKSPHLVSDLPTSRPEPRRLDQKRLAILLMCSGVASLVVSDAMAKELVQRFHPFQILFVRSLMASLMLVAIILAIRGASHLKTHKLWPHIIRAVCAAGATYFFIGSLAELPLAEATSIIFLAPIFVALLSPLLLKETLKAPQIIAILGGFVGALIILRPGADVFGWASAYALAGAFFSALVMMSARLIDPRDGFWTMTLYLAIFSALISGASLGLDWPDIRTEDGALMTGVAVFGTLGVALIVQAFRTGEAATVAPFDYTALIWATLLGVVIWQDLPDFWVYVGAAVIIASGIYLALSEDA